MNALTEPRAVEGVGLSDEHFETFYRDEYAAAARLAYLLCGTQLISDDIVQDSFLAIEKHFPGVGHPSAYLRTAVVRRCASWHRTNSRRAGLLPKLYTDASVAADDTELFDVLATLPYEQRAALTLRFWCDMNLAEIADALGCRVGTVKSSISRGLARLRLELKEVM